ncbi:hypothetical protein EDM58_20635 [Brevibacillus panacihumi]|uniref:Uncharacterized protein n=1 Tax=Brevibacillus panacihumi TaxID=497735 RepID=A0A3M8CCJ1_9BACL|nr:hypothetical protein EDM58_20635 [Brevibacillus panacihumi]
MIAFVTSVGKFPESINLNVSVNRIGGAKGSWIGSYRECQNTALFFVLPLTNRPASYRMGDSSREDDHQPRQGNQERHEYAPDLLADEVHI